MPFKNCWNIDIVIKEQFIQQMEGDKLSEYQHLIDAGQFEKAQYIGDNFFRDGNINQAIQVYKKMIERNYQVKFEIAGLGSSQLSISRFEWFIYQWYDDQRNAKKIIGNAFDALSLCYLQSKDQNEIQRGILWYEDMLGTRESYELYMGYANLLCKKGRYDEAVKMYNRVILHRPTLVNAYVCTAMIHEYRRIQKSKSISMAKKILEKDPNNMYAVFILARNIENVDEKIEKLKIGYERFPDYVRIANDVGITYGTKKQHRQAIKWYRKCIQLAPLYAAAYNNVGVRTEMLKEYQQALVWYFKACELDHEYKAAHKNATDIFDELKFDDDRIIAQMSKYVKLDPFMFYYYIGLAYYDKDKVDKSIKWYKKAEELNADNFELMNSMGIAYDQIKKYDQAEQYYQLCIALNPKYHMAYYNMGILQKSRKNIDKAAEWYRKATEVNPRYNKPYNNLGNIYKNNKQYDEAVDCFEKAVELNTTYTLGWTNLAVCLLNLERYQDAFYAFSRAKQLLPTDNNGLSEGNKAFLKESLDKFDKQGEKWKKTATISHDQKQNLRHMIHSYESNFKQAPSILQVAPVSNDIALRPEILEVVKLIYRDQFLLKEASQLVNLLKTLSFKDIQYFHILPQYLIQYFLKNTTELCKSPLKVQEELSQFIKTVTHKEKVQSQKKALDVKKIDDIIKGFGFPEKSHVNLFKQSTFFGSYEALYAQFEMTNRSAEESLNQFIQLVEAIRIRSNGVSCGTKMTLPKRANQQFVIMTTIIKKILSEQINESWNRSTIEKLGDFVLSEGEKATIGSVIHKIIDIWSDEITAILKVRFEKQIETVCCLQDLLHSELMFESADDLLKAVQACDKQSRLKGHEVIKCINRLEDINVWAVVINIKINDAVCELHLSPRHDENQSKWTESLEEIKNSTFGCIFGSFLYLSRSFKYPLLANCKDIQARLKESPISVAARYIINVLQAKP